ncbi:4739_t:CDS:1, partial [Acaulospora morrowiae]
SKTGEQAVRKLGKPSVLAERSVNRPGTPTEKEQGRRDSRKRDCDAEDCPKRDNLLLGSPAMETRRKEDEGRTEHSTQDLHTVEDETPAPKNDNHCDEGETLPDMRDRNKPSEEITSNDQNKTLIEEIGQPKIDVPTCTPTDVIAKLGERHDKTPMITNDETPRKENEMPKTTNEHQEKMVNDHTSKTMGEGTNDDEALTAEDDKKDNDVNETTEPAGDETPMNKNSGLSSEGSNDKKMVSVPKGGDGSATQSLERHQERERRPEDEPRQRTLEGCSAITYDIDPGGGSRPEDTPQT